MKIAIHVDGIESLYDTSLKGLFSCLWVLITCMYLKMSYPSNKKKHYMGNFLLHGHVLSKPEPDKNTNWRTKPPNTQASQCTDHNESH